MTVGDGDDGLVYHHAALVSPATMRAVATTLSTHLRNARDAVDAGAATGNVNASDRRNRTIPMSDKRTLRSFSRPRLNNSLMGSGRPAGSAFHAGSLRTMAAIVSVTSSPSNTRLPVSISNNTHANAQMSLRLSAARPLACSGAM